jgi:hypothetical protein
MSGVLPASLLCAAAALVLARGSIPHIAAGVVVVALGALAGTNWPDGTEPTSPARLFAWMSLASLAACAALGRGRPGARVRLLLALNGGIWAGASTGPGLHLAAALAWLGLVAPAYVLVRTRAEVAGRVAASWLLTIGVLNAAIPLTTPTPGYARDHME